MNTCRAKIQTDKNLTCQIELNGYMQLNSSLMNQPSYRKGKWGGFELSLLASQKQAKNGAKI